MPDWTLISNHGLVLSYIARHPRSTAREIALAAGITERTTHKIIADLEEEGYIERRRLGRSNAYHINPDRRLRHKMHGEIIVGDLLKALGWKQRRKTRTVKPPTESGCAS
jgi:DNA-binding Lrp family transcriptional regulator